MHPVNAVSIWLLARARGKCARRVFKIKRAREADTRLPANESLRGTVRHVIYGSLCGLIARLYASARALCYMYRLAARAQTLRRGKLEESRQARCLLHFQTIGAVIWVTSGWGFFSQEFSWIGCFGFFFFFLFYNLRNLRLYVMHISNWKFLRMFLYERKFWNSNNAKWRPKLYPTFTMMHPTYVNFTYNTWKAPRVFT